MLRTVPTYPTCSIREAHERLTAAGSPFEMDTVMIRGRATRVWKHAPPVLIRMA
jgi:long-chain acyl-CoA synthetase